MGLYHWFYRICFHRVLFQISGIIIIILYMYTFWLTTCVLPPTGLLFLSYYTIMFPTWYPLLSLCLLLYVCAYDMVFQHALLIQIYQYTCAYPCTPLGIHHTTHWGVSDSLGSACSDLRAWSCRFFWLLIRVAQWKCESSANRLRPILPGPLLGSRVSFHDSWAPFVSYVLDSRICAYQWCNVFCNIVSHPVITL